MSTTKLSQKALLALLENKQPVTIIDVREAAEFQEVHLRGSRNMPLSQLESQLTELNPASPIILLCQSGSRANRAAQLFNKANFKQVQIFSEGISQLQTSANEHLVYPAKQKLWSVDRQFRFALGLLIALGLAGKWLVNDWFLIIPAIICVGLIFTALIDQCYFRAFIAWLPWNRSNALS